MQTIFLVSYLITINSVISAKRGSELEKGKPTHDTLDNIVQDIWEQKFHRFSGRDVRSIDKCPQRRYGNVTHTLTQAHGFGQPLSSHSFYSVHHALMNVGIFYNKRSITTRVAYVDHPFHTVSVEAPHGDCGPGSGQTVKNTGRGSQCVLAVNAGLFNVSDHSCLGNVVSNNRMLLDAQGIQSAHFGIKRDGQIFIGYLSEIDTVAEDFVQLVGGMVWLLKGGEPYIDESLAYECPSVQTTGSLETFINIISARTAIGVDSEGRVMLVQVDGKTGNQGVNLHELADIMKSLGAVHAINLDGGGSSTFVINDTLVNYPSDQCTSDKRFNCARNVTTIICVHSPVCSPKDCNNHGSCILGQCQCVYPWRGESCDVLKCKHQCSNRGRCTPEGCLCFPGFRGDDCSMSCATGWYGLDCAFPCTCLHGSTCHHENGTCLCPDGYIGDKCQHKCPYGYHGKDCANLCLCPDGCPCDHITGSCNWTDLDLSLQKGGKCYADHLISEKHLVPDKSKEHRAVQTALICVCIVAAASILGNIILIQCMCTRRPSSSSDNTYSKSHSIANSSTYLFDNHNANSDDDASSFEEYEMNNTTRPLN